MIDPWQERKIRGDWRIPAGTLGCFDNGEQIGGSVVTVLLLWAGAIGAIQIVVFVVWASWRTSDYSVMTHTVSQLASQGRPEARTANRMFFLHGVLVSLLAFGLRSVLSGIAAQSAILVFMLTYGISVSLTAVAQDHPEDEDETKNLEGHIHRALAHVAVLALIAGMCTFAAVGPRLPNGNVLRYGTISLAGITCLLGVVYLLISERIRGLIQRSMFAVIQIWICFVSLFALASLLPHWSLSGLLQRQRGAKVRPRVARAERVRRMRAHRT